MSNTVLDNMRSVLSQLGISCPESSEDLIDNVYWNAASRNLSELFQGIDQDKQEINRLKEQVRVTNNIVKDLRES